MVDIMNNSTKAIIIFSLLLFVSCRSTRSNENYYKKEQTDTRKVTITRNSIEFNRLKVSQTKEKGTLNNPYSTYDDAAEHIIPRLAQSLVSLDLIDSIYIKIVPVQKDIPMGLVAAFRKSVSENRIHQIIPEESLTIFKKQDQAFAVSRYIHTEKSKLKVANALLELDVKQKSSDIRFLEVRLSTFQFVASEKYKHYPAGEILPRCSFNGYVKSQNTEDVYHQYERLFSRNKSTNISFTVKEKYSQIIVNDFGNNQRIHFRIEQITPDGMITMLYPTDIVGGVIKNNHTKQPIIRNIHTVIKDNTVNARVYMLVNTSEVMIESKTKIVEYARKGIRLSLEKYKNNFNNLNQWEVFSEL